MGCIIKPREFAERQENERLSEFAVRSADSTRKRVEIKCDYRTEFQRDRDRITHSKAFRRLSHKTQVFIAPEGDHYRTRLSHTLEVTQISRTIARALRLNEDLTEAIALGHDLGHTPFGHTGEDALDSISPMGFRHNEQSVRILEKLENNHMGCNLTDEVTDGIYHHRSSGTPGTLEGRIVQLSDKIAYLNHDIDDAIRAGLLKSRDIPEVCTRTLGSTSVLRINALVSGIIESSFGKDYVSMEPEHVHAFNLLREFMFATVYHNQLIQTERMKIHHVIKEIHNYYCMNINELPPEFIAEIENGERIEKVACDHIACMTDRFAIKVYTNISMPSSWNRY